MSETERGREPGGLPTPPTPMGPPSGKPYPLPEGQPGGPLAHAMHTLLSAAFQSASAAAVIALLVAGYATLDSYTRSGYSPGLFTSFLTVGAGLLLFASVAGYLYLIASRVHTPVPAHFLLWTWILPIAWVVLATIIGHQAVRSLSSKMQTDDQRQGLAHLSWLPLAHAVLTVGLGVTFQAASAGESGISWVFLILAAAAAYALVYIMAAVVELSAEKPFVNNPPPFPLAVALTRNGQKTKRDGGYPAPPGRRPGTDVAKPIAEDEKEVILKSLKTMRELHEAGNLDERDYLRLQKDAIRRLGELGP